MYMQFNFLGEIKWLEIVIILIVIVKTANVAMIVSAVKMVKSVVVAISVRALKNVIATKSVIAKNTQSISVVAIINRGYNDKKYPLS